MSIRALNWAWGLGPGIEPSERLVLLALADHADEMGVCWPSIAKVTERCGLSASTVRRSLQGLRAVGLVKWFPQMRDNGSQKSNGYVLNIEDVDYETFFTEGYVAKPPEPKQRKRPPVTVTPPPVTGDSPPLSPVTPLEPSIEPPKNQCPPAAAEVDPWAFAVPLLTAQGVSEGTARGFVGKLAKEHGNAKVFQAFVEARGVAAADVKSYVCAVLAMNKASQTVEKWWESDQGTEKKAREVGVTPRAGESWADLRRRIKEKLAGASV